MERAVSTAGYVKLSPPPRQSRGNSHWGLADIYFDREGRDCILPVVA